MALAHRLGRTLAEIGELDLDELALWAAWLREYDPELRKDLRAGVLAATVANSAFGSKGRWEPQDFFPSLKPRTAIRDGDEMERRLLAWCVNAGGTVKVERAGKQDTR